MEGRDDSLLDKLKEEKDWNNSCIFTSTGEVIVDNGCSLLEDEIEFYIQAFDDRDTTVGNGFFVNDVHFDVHRFHPPLIYGRRGGPEDGEGIALARVVPNNPRGDEEYWYLLITYLLPILSAKAVPQMVDFSNNNLGENKNPSSSTVINDSILTEDLLHPKSPIPSPNRPLHSPSSKPALPPQPKFPKTPYLLITVQFLT